MFLIRPKHRGAPALLLAIICLGAARPAAAADARRPDPALGGVFGLGILAGNGGGLALEGAFELREGWFRARAGGSLGAIGFRRSTDRFGWGYGAARLELGVALPIGELAPGATVGLERAGTVGINGEGAGPNGRSHTALTVALGVAPEIARAKVWFGLRAAFPLTETVNYVPDRPIPPLTLAALARF